MALKCRSLSRYWLMKKKTPYITDGTSIIVKYAGPRRRSVKRRIGRSGCARRRSTCTKETNSTALRTKELRVTDRLPCSASRMKP
jgi:hypothetical protein